MSLASFSARALRVATAEPEIDVPLISNLVTWPVTMSSQVPAVVRNFPALPISQSGRELASSSDEVIWPTRAMPAADVSSITIQYDVLLCNG